MNVYFWLFSLYALFIMPVTVKLSMKIEKNFQLNIAFITAGKKVYEFNGKKADGTRTSDGVDQMERLFLAVQLFRSGTIQKAFSVIRLQRFFLFARLSFSDAALTAIVYGAIRVLIQTLDACISTPVPVTGRVEAQFNANHPQIEMTCIFSARLGMLAIAAANVLRSVRRTQAALLLKEEEKYAAASH